MRLACPHEIGMNLGSSQPRIVRRRHDIAPVEHGGESLNRSEEYRANDGAQRLRTPVVGCSQATTGRPPGGGSASRNHHTPTGLPSRPVDQ